MNKLTYHRLNNILYIELTLSADFIDCYISHKCYKVQLGKYFLTNSFNNSKVRTYGIKNNMRILFGKSYTISNIKENRFTIPIDKSYGENRNYLIKLDTNKCNENDVNNYINDIKHMLYALSKSLNSNRQKLLHNKFL